MRTIRVLGILAITMVVSVLAGACQSDDADAGADLNNGDWCQYIFDEGPTPEGWAFDKVQRDCKDGLDAGYSRDEIVAIYCTLDGNPPDGFC